MLTDRAASPPAWARPNRVQVHRHRACEVEHPFHDPSAKKEFNIEF